MGLAQGHLVFPILLGKAYHHIAQVTSEILEQADKLNSQLTTKRLKEHLQHMKPNILSRRNVMLHRLQVTAGILGLTLSPLDPTAASLLDGSGPFQLPQKKRVQRQVFLGLSFIFGLAGAGLSLYNLHEIKEIKMSIKEGRDIIAREMELQTKLLKVTAEGLNVVVDSLKTLDKEVAEARTMQEFQEATHDLMWEMEEEVNNMVDGLIATSQGHLSCHVISTEEVQEGMEHLKLIANGKNYTMVNVNPYTLPISHTAESETLTVILHVPFVRKNLFKLFEFIPVPVNNNGIGMILNSDEKFLAFDSNNEGIILHSLQNCKQIVYEKLMICENEILHLNAFNTTCLGAVYQNDIDLTKKLCSFQFVKETFELYNIGNDHLLVSAGVKVMVSCGKNKTTIGPFNQTKLLTTVRGCDYETENMKFETRDDIIEQLNETELIPIHVLEKVWETIHVDDVTDLEMKLKQYKKVSDFDFDRMTSTIKELRSLHITGGSGFGFLFCFLMLIIIFYLVGYCKYRNNHK